MKQADMINEEMLFSYVMNEPGNIFRQYELGLEQNFVWTFGKELIDSRMGLYFKSMFNNMWEVTSSAGRHFSALDPRILRGGPALASNPFWSSEIHLNTNSSKDLFFDMGYNYQFNENNLLQYHSVSGEVRWRPINRISLSNNLEYTTRYTGQQYINQYTPGDEDLYFFGDLDQKILSLIIRAALYITPEMSLEYYGNPYMSVGDYTNFKKVREPHADEFKEKFYHYRDHQVEYLSDENRYHITDPVHGDFEIINPDFNFAQFRSNLVFRWEYKLGSVLYLVWSHAQTYDENISRMSLRNDFDQLLGIPSKDVFMLKFNYWFSI
ncbi:MAG: DUF5916 domain-containing protein, partial [Bacteroidales bacterium]|nr:DUF5916 domain-containing protein [Bacteroidales bacterium]